MVDALGSDARFSRPSGLAIDPGGSILYVADAFNYRVRAIDFELRVRSIVHLEQKIARASAPGTALPREPDHLPGTHAGGRPFILETATRVRVACPTPPHHDSQLVGGDIS
jgi:sugar lactone lactonase YvrE